MLLIQSCLQDPHVSKCWLTAGESWQDISQKVMMEVRFGTQLSLRNQIPFVLQTFRSVKHFMMSIGHSSKFREV